MTLRQARESHTLTVKYRGGAECFWEIRYGFRTFRASGVMTLHDVLAWVLELER